MSEHGHEEVYSRTMVGFWTYLMTDCILFATLFATYAVLHKGTFGGPSSQDLFNLPFALAETIILLVSSFTSGLASIAMQKGAKKLMLFWLGVTFLLGASFLHLELTEFGKFIAEGNSWERSAFLSAFFTLVGTHGLHITLGLFWLVVLAIPIFKQGLTPTSIKRLTCWKLFWHFLDLVWIFIFTVVYLMGVI
jgi:cytochrome o ubiquinol oxidase subunit 3